MTRYGNLNLHSDFSMPSINVSRRKISLGMLHGSCTYNRTKAYKGLHKGWQGEAYIPFFCETKRTLRLKPLTSRVTG
jgi:hypothetical protein